MWRNTVIQNVNILYANDSITGTHNCRNVMRIKYIFQHNCKVGLSLA